MHQLPPALKPLASHRQFVLWISRPSSKRPGATDKLPINPLTGQVHDAHDLAIHLDADTAIKLAADVDGAGIGFVFTEADPFFFLDIDKCLINGAWSPLAVELCHKLAGAAVEVSQSGQGLHIIGTTPPVAHGCKNIAQGLELYTSGRFVALTGVQATGSADFSPPGVVDVIIEYFPPAAHVNTAEWTNGPCPEWNGPADDDELIAKMLKSVSKVAMFNPNKATVQALWTADEDVLMVAYPDGGGDRTFDHSSADAALCQHLAFWTGKDCERIDRLFRRSGLNRGKWIDRPDYRQSTILHGVGFCNAVYGSRPKAPDVVIERMAKASDTTIEVAPTDSNQYRAGMQYLAITQQLEYFKGCVYVADLHRVFTPKGTFVKEGQFKATFGGFIFALDSMNNKVTKNAWEVFTESQGAIFPKVDSTCFRPEEPPGAIIEEESFKLLNTYVPIITPRIVGDPAPFLDLLSRILPVERDREILLSYMAACIQYRGRKFQWTPLLQGVQGNGKTLILSCMTYAIGNRYSHLPNALELGSGGAKFSGWISRKLFIGIEEIYVSDRREVLDALKPLIANSRIEIQNKGQDQFTGDNRANFMMFSNHKDAILKTRDDRRFCVFYTAQQTADDLIRDGIGGDYFPRLAKWLDGDGRAIVNEYLSTYDISPEFNPAELCHRAPKTSSTAEALLTSLGGIEQEILEAVDEGQRGFVFPWVSSLALDRLIEERKDRKRLPPNKRKEILFGLGYIQHPALKGGRTNNIIAADNGKPRLYIKSDHADAELKNAGEVTRRYEDAQEPKVLAPGSVGEIFSRKPLED